ncbi:MAG TPA: hypothetical protein IAA04_09290 [Candidatus Lachnoclostridium pullistercoris]|uniref:Peptidase M1 membrane alanine aminopeptidase domain-containing protein n=1 Tax=Candidatus Lachnoclostridium pullistercoris TaxID=2838632 RepID=A0A9D2PCF0_9FIRM|nr:hypothetical protein [Candidatus Lachnoclostridium pullistercoris]
MSALIFLEWKRLLSRPSARLILFLTIFSPAAGLFLFRPSAADTMSSVFLANPALAGGAAGGILFGLLSISELDRGKRSGTDVLVWTAVSPYTMAAVRLWALLSAALAAFVLTAALWIPAGRILAGSVFDVLDAFWAYFIFMGLALPLAILAAVSAFQFTGRADLSLALFGAFAILSLTLWSGNWQLCWLNPCVWALSDDFSNFRIFRSAAYMRLTWAAGLSGLWILSRPAVRRRKKRAAALFLLLTFFLAWTFQPFTDHSDPDQSVSSFDQIPPADGISCVRRSVRLFPDLRAGTVRGTAVYHFLNTSGKPQSAAFGINPGYRICSASAGGTAVPFSFDGRQEFNEALLEVTLPTGSETELVLEYGGFPREDRSLSAMQGSAEISEEYLYLPNADLAPRLLNVRPAGETIPAVTEITLPSHMTVIPFGPSHAEITAENEDGTLTWRYESEGTGGICYAGDYVRQDIEADGITVEFYYGRKHQDVMEEAGAAEAIQAVIRYCTEHYGPPFCLSGRTLKLIQSRTSGGGYATDGASLLDEADFTAANLKNSAKGAAPGEVMIHELVHQWWGLTQMFDSSDPADPWSAEGLTVYTTYRIVKELYGEEYADTHYTDQWIRETNDYYLNFYVRRPEYFSRLPKKKQLDITNRFSRVRQYCEMPLKIRKAEQLAGGEENMDRILRGLFSREIDPFHPFLTWETFLNACGLTEEDLNLDHDFSI